MPQVAQTLGRGLLGRLLTGLSSKRLAIVLGLLFCLDMLTPDPLPLIDEAVLLLLTMLAARWPSRRQEAQTATPPTEPAAAGPAGKPPAKNVTPR